MMETPRQPTEKKIHIGFRRAMMLLCPYIWKRIRAQVQSVWLIIVYLFLFQILVLRLAVDDALVISAGLVIVILGLTLFLEGLFLGLMSLGEAIGLRLPRKSGITVILAFSFILGVGATFAEPAIGVLRMAGSSVLAWEAPLLFLLLNKHADFLVYAVAVGVGVAVMAGMLRFIYNLSLKPFIYALVGSLAVLSAWAWFDPNLRHVTGLAWDCGAVTTGPVTVPLVLALGIGISRVLSGSSSGGGSGFGVVTLASLFPVLAVLILAISLGPSVPPPMEETCFFSTEHRASVETLFENRDAMRSYAFREASEKSQALLFEGGREEMLRELGRMTEDEEARAAVFGAGSEALRRWAVEKGSEAQRRVVFETEAALRDAMNRYIRGDTHSVETAALARSAVAASARAIIPLTVFLLVVLVLILREKLPRADEVMLGILLAFVGMAFLTVGIELGLARLGNQVGGKLPALFESIALEEERSTVMNFDPRTVVTALTSEGEHTSFFFMRREGEGVKAVPYDPAGYDEKSGTYTFTPSRGPIFEGWGGFSGILVLLLFAFIMGYGATLAEPALNALAVTVEELTVGTFKKTALLQAVAVGVGAGIALGVAKIIWDVSLAWLILPPYVLLLLITALSDEEYVNIGWDSAGVTTGPVTVPLVLAMGLGIGSQVGGVEGFGILAAASVCPILSVLLVGLVVNWKRRRALGGEPAPPVPEVAYD
ncbi:MAG TPA: DUF1538 domain-containing protein [Deltaproteobacteria bacterium]|nr:DUF1538 domain-containing protein [Deltaproteobacteria bacterium]